uniref:Uncharacterized protein n=1 Tax=Ignisphaera aggregans TaxID=334771 RepID=A0A7C4FGP5_9CREN
MRVLVAEYLVTCFRKEMVELYRDILVEGYAMVYSLSSILSRAGLDVQVAVSRELEQHFFL